MSTRDDRLSDSINALTDRANRAEARARRVAHDRDFYSAAFDRCLALVAEYLNENSAVEESQLRKNARRAVALRFRRALVGDEIPEEG